MGSKDELLWRDIWGVTHVVCYWVDAPTMTVISETTLCGMTVKNRFSEFLYSRVVSKPAHPTCLWCVER